jgi:glutamyl-tRNA reductase
MNKRDEISEIILLGLSHKTAPLEIRERFSIEAEALKDFYRRVKELGIEEIVYLSTCNRVEVYFTAKDVHESIRKLTLLLEEYTGLDGEVFSKYAYIKHSRDAVLHLLTVASSLDSMIIGENEILGQVKQAYRDSVHHKNSGVILNRLFHQSFNTAKKVRTRTAISQNPLSIAYIAVEQARKLFNGNLSDRKALLVGAGEMGELILRYLSKNGVCEITIANRSVNNAEAVAEKIDRCVRVIPLDDICAQASGADIIITSAACHDHLIDRAMAESIAARREGALLCIIDIAVPRNVDPAVAGIPSVSLINIDDLKIVADENLKNRRNEAESAMQIVREDAADLLEWYEGLEIVPVIVRMQDIFDRIREQELDKYRRRQFKHLCDEDLQLIDDLTKQILSKILHNPIMAIKEYKASHADGYHTKEEIREKIKTLEELFRP